MFHLVGADNRDPYREHLQRMFELRAVSRERRPGGGPEAVALGPDLRDGFDDAEALYLLRFDGFGDIACAHRVRPTLHGSLIGAYYPAAVAAESDPVEAPGVWEFSHYYSREDPRSERGMKVRAEMRLAILAAAAEAGVRRLVSITESERWPFVVASGWKVRRLGPEVSYAPGHCAVAFEVAVGAADLAAFRSRLREELSASLAEAGEPYGELGEILTAVDSLGPGALSLVNALTRQLAEIEETEGADAAVALAEALRRSLRGEAPS